RLARGAGGSPPRFELIVLQRGAVGPRLSRALATALADRRISLAELRGQPVVLNFWASWCPPCRTEAPRLQRAWVHARSQGTLFVGLNQQDLTGDARAFMLQYGITYPNIRDPSDDVARAWGLTGLPETFF